MSRSAHVLATMRIAAQLFLSTMIHGAVFDRHPGHFEGHFEHDAELHLPA